MPSSIVRLAARVILVLRKLASAAELIKAQISMLLLRP
jgi:hypothetical protein